MPYSPSTTGFPSSIDSLSNPSDSSDTSTFDHAGLESTQNDAIEALETKVGINSSADTSSLDYLVKNTSSSNPGHKHTLANGATDVTATYTELNYVDGVTSAIQTQLDAKAPIASPTFTGTVTLPTGLTGIASLASGVVSAVTAPSGTIVGTSDTQTLTNKTIGTTNLISINSPQGYLINGKIVPSVSSNNLTVAIKGLDGNDPSSTNPVYCRIGDSIRSITGALSVTKNAGTNWFNSGASESATKEIDYFVYLGYNATDGVVIGFSRICDANKYGDFSATTTNDKYCAISTITTAASTDYYELIGRFAATLSAGAGYTWTVPTFTASNLIQRPIFETRWMDWVPTYTQSGSLTLSSISTYEARYKVMINRIMFISAYQGTLGGTGSTDLYFTIPMTCVIGTNGDGPFIGTAVVSGSVTQSGAAYLSTTTKVGLRKYDVSNYATSGNGGAKSCGWFQI